VSYFPNAQPKLQRLMKLLDLTLPTPAENVALDEALLDAAEAGQLADEVLRLWDPQQLMVVAGRSSQIDLEVNLPACQVERVPILRRSSGGAAIVSGPGCLMYAVVLRYTGREHLRLIDEAHRHVLGQIAAALRGLIGGVEHVGISDLAIGDRKFSGNSLRCKRDHLLYHGTVLYNFDLSLIDRLLKMPPRQPQYRAGRPHGDFVMNLRVAGIDLQRALVKTFEAHEPLTNWPRELTRHLVSERYSRDAWTFDR
jgi:lipoate-protein ligase A